MSWSNSREWEQFLSMLVPKPAEKILDIGSGSGKVASKVLEASKGVEVYAVDPSEKRIAIMKKEYPGLRGSVAKAEKLPFPDSEFDKAYTTMALHHFADLGASLKEVARVLKGGGSFVVLDVNPDSGLGRFFRYFGRLTGEHVNLLGREALGTLFERSGLFAVQESASLGSRYLILLTRI